MKGYEKLIVWQVADEFVFQIYERTKGFPRQEQYGLIAQLRRAAVSIPTNIAEGTGRQGKNETRQFANIALGSLAECEYLVRLSSRLGFFNEHDRSELCALSDRVGALLWGFYKSL